MVSKIARKSKGSLLPLLFSGGDGRVAPINPGKVNMKAFYKMDEVSGNAIDVHSSLDLTHLNDPGSAAGLITNSRVFVSASNELFNHADTPDLSVGDNDWVCAFYLYPAVEQSDWLVTKYSASEGQREFIIGRNFTDPSHLMLCQFFDGTNTIGQAASVNNLILNAWNSVVVMHDAGNNKVKISANGETIVEGALSGTVIDGTLDFLVGGLVSGAGSYDGRLDQLTVIKGNVWTQGNVAWHNNDGDGRAYSEY